MFLNVRAESIKLFLLRFILNHNFSVVAASGIAVVLLSASILGRVCNAPPKMYFPRKASDFSTEKNIEKKLKKVKDKLDKDPSDLASLCEEAILKFQKGSEYYPEAIIALEKAKYGGLLDARIFYYLGTMYQREGLYPYSETEFIRFLYNYPGDYDASMLLGRTYYAQKKYNEAANLYYSLLPKHKKDKTLLSNLAFSLHKSGQEYQWALKELKKRGKEGKYLSLSIEGEIFLEKGLYEESLAVLQAAEIISKYSKRDAHLHIMIARDMAASGNIAGAKEKLGNLLNLFPDNEEAATLLKEIITSEKKENKIQTEKKPGNSNSNQRSSRKKR